ncbi:hypothetical protein BTM25_16650 [Actinomadura rubteroloni]|uniref:Uncharacterized protein n=1 Tax=Actinomadura rubteroloni TaxID=1926885 RepID=A0A2P4UQF3_9ACTN|nr:hypothetical protein [Actinomadura rubteroloni]POM27254.1 hypothetical protein BTM25_16650 [Actinomadura rubteroloni]
MNLLNDPTLVYLRAVLGTRVHRLRTEDRGRGASAIEWAIITAILAAIALAIGATIMKKISDKADSINTGT